SLRTESNTANWVQFGGVTLAVLLKQDDTRREAVDEVLPAHGAQLPLSKEPGQWQHAHFLPNRADIMVRRRKQPGAAAVAGEDEGPTGTRLVRAPIGLQEGE